MKIVTTEEFKRAERVGYVGTYLDSENKHPEWKGKRTLLAAGEGGTTLYIEGVSFQIADNNDFKKGRDV